MSYGVRWVSPDGKTGQWTAPFATREDAEEHAALRQMANGLSYTVEEIGLSPIDAKPEPTSTTERLVGLLRDRHARGLAKYGTTLDRTDLAPGEWAQHAIDEALDLAGYLMRVKDWFAPEPGSTATQDVEILRERAKELEEVQKAMLRDLSFAIQIGDAMREAMRTGEWRAGHDKSMASSAVAGWDRWKRSLAASPQGTAKASEAPGEGGDSGRSRLEALRAFLDGNEDASLTWWEGEFCAVAEDVAITAPTLAALADKLMEKKEAKP